MSRQPAPFLVRPLQVRDPRAALRALAGLPYPFLLHSLGGAGRARWSLFGADPFEVHRGGSWDDALASFRARARSVRDAAPSATSSMDGLTDAPFTGGAVGYWSYDFGRRFERIPSLAADDLGLPDFVVGFYDVTGAFDHATGKAWVFSSGLPLAESAGSRRAADRIDVFARRMEALANGHSNGAGDGAGDDGHLAHAPRAARSTFSPDGYRRAIETVQEHIRCGDIFQANLSQRWTLALDGMRHAGVASGTDATGPRAGDALALDLFDALTALSPAPFAAFFDAGDHAIVSSSPERFLEVRGRRVETRPIKGTRPRGMCRAEDETLAAELATSAKDRAENVMIVDVLRNDLGRVCEIGSVMVPELCALETFPQVFHLTSTVTGVLRDGIDAFDLLRAAFPGGSITGAPKLRAIEILEALEPVRRHVYTGAIGYVGWNGDADWNIAIRTALVTPAALHFAAGGGITAESSPDAEYLETLHKAEGLRLALAAVVGPVALTAARETAR